MDPNRKAGEWRGGSGVPKLTEDRANGLPPPRTNWPVPPPEKEGTVGDGHGRKLQSAMGGHWNNGWLTGTNKCQNKSHHCIRPFNATCHVLAIRSVRCVARELFATTPSFSIKLQWKDVAWELLARKKFRMFHCFGTFLFCF